MEEVKLPLYSDQTEDATKTGYIHWMVRNPDHVVNKVSDRRISISIIRNKIEMLRGFQSVEDILANVTLIPLDKKEYTIQQLARFIMEDALCPPPVAYNEYGVIAYSGRHPTDRPIAMVKKDGKEIYYAHPEISRLIRRINNSYTTENV